MYMKLSEKVLILWYGRIIAADFIMIPVIDVTFTLNIFGYLLIVLINLFLFAILYLRYINIDLSCESFIIINSGFLIKQQIIIHPTKILGTKEIRTPVSTALCLAYVVIYCEGKRYILPPTEKKIRQEITDLIKKEKEAD